MEHLLILEHFVRQAKRSVVPEYAVRPTSTLAPPAPTALQEEEPSLKELRLVVADAALQAKRSAIPTQVAAQLLN